MHPSDVRDAQPRLLIFDFFPDSAALTKRIVQPLDVHSLELIQLNIAKRGTDVGMKSDSLAMRSMYVGPRC